MPKDIRISQLIPKVPKGTDVFIVTSEDNVSGSVSLNGISAFFKTDASSTDTLSGTKFTKQELRSYTGPLMRIAYVSDALAGNLAVLRTSDQTSPDTADTNAPDSIITDALGRRYRLMDTVSFLSLILESYQPENL